MKNTVDEISPQEMIDQHVSELWDQNLYDPRIYDALILERESLRLFTRSDLFLLASFVVLTAWMGFSLHWTLFLVGSVAAAVFVSQKRAKLQNSLREIDYLIGDPSPLFNSIAVNKIVMEVRDRSPELKEYTDALMTQGRRTRVTAFELEKMLKVLGVLDRIDRGL